MFRFRTYVGITVLVILFAEKARGSQCTFDVGERTLYCQEGLKIEKDGKSQLYYRLMKNIFLTEIKNITEVLDLINRNNFDDVTLVNSNVTILPISLMTIPEVKGITVTGNNMPSINLNILPYAKDLVKLNLSNNGITEIETASAPLSYMSTKKLKLIDLSHNEISHITEHNFYHVRDSLEYLNLAHNKISTIDLYGFSSLISLKGLWLSYNKIATLGSFLYPMRNLVELYLNHNELNTIDAEVFEKSTRLRNLDLSSNNIELIENQPFAYLADLDNLNLKNNSINTIKEILFRNNTNLKMVDFSYNNIGDIEPGTFSQMKKLHDIRFERALSMPILYGHIFAGKLRMLNFAGSKIKKIGDRPFIALGKTLVTLHLNSSSIEEISETAFESLTSLEILNLSNNNLTEISFQTIDLENLASLNLHNNNIRELKSRTFENLFLLKNLDLSNNDIKSILPMTFKNCKNVESIYLGYNTLDGTIQSNTFFGLESVKTLDLVKTNVVSFDSYAFSGLKSLKVLNASHGKLRDIDYYAFGEITNIEILDLSYNEIYMFNVKLLLNKKIKEIYLNNNELLTIPKQALEGFDDLNILNLSHNSLITLDALAFEPLVSLQYLDLSHNPEIKLNGNIFKYLPELTTAILRNASGHIDFEFESNVCVKNLDLSHSYISNVSQLHLQNIKNLETLDLSYNNITILDQFSIKYLPSLIDLNLSHNAIGHINPGTFLGTKNLKSLDLSHNKLSRIQYGALSGLTFLKTLNISSNILFSFELSLLNYVPLVTDIYLDNNNIRSLSFPKFGTYSLKKLSIGGNFIFCDDILDLRLHSNVSITAEPLDLFSENVEGIPCSYIQISEPNSISEIY